MNEPWNFSDPPAVLNNRYHLRAILGKGRLGAIYRASDVIRGYDVVITFIAPTHSGVEIEGAEFTNEIQIIQQLMHPQIVALYGLEQDGRWSYLVVDLLGNAQQESRQNSIPVVSAQNATLTVPAPIPLLAQDVQRYTASEDTIAAVEAERKHLVSMLQQHLAEPLHLLLSQANAYEQSFSGQPIAQMAVSVLATIARQLLQQLRDLEADLHPQTLETLGLVPALELLAGQFMRATNAHIRLILERIPERLPMPSELAFFRLTQAALTRAIHAAHATQITIRLERQSTQVRYSIIDNGIGDENSIYLNSACQRIKQLGGAIEMGIHSRGGFELSLLFPLVVTPLLTPREMEVLLLLAEGLTNKQIATRLIITPRTVNFHLDNIYLKLNVNTRTEASIVAMRMGWVKQE